MSKNLVFTRIPLWAQFELKKQIDIEIKKLV